MPPQQNLRNMVDSWLRTRLIDPAADPILLVEDSEADIFFFLRAFKATGVRNPIFVMRTGQDALEYLRGEGMYGDRAAYPQPKVIFLDLYMSPLSGWEVLKWKETEPAYRHALWVALSSSGKMADINRAYQYGASTFLSKPLNSSDLANLLDAYRTYWSLGQSAVDSADLDELPL